MKAFNRTDARRLAMPARWQHSASRFCAGLSKISRVSSTSVLPLMLLCFLGLAAVPCIAQTPVQKEYERKAALLHHIIEYVDWPSDSSSDQPPPILIGLLGQIPFPEALEVLDGKRIRGRKVVVKRISTSEEVLNSQVLFIG